MIFCCRVGINTSSCWNRCIVVPGMLTIAPILAGPVWAAPGCGFSSPAFVARRTRRRQVVQGLVLKSPERYFTSIRRPKPDRHYAGQRRHARPHRCYSIMSTSASYRSPWNYRLVGHAALEENTAFTIANMASSKSSAVPRTIFPVDEQT